VSGARYLALGDSYTIGEGVAPGERWPVQLAAALRRRGLPVGDPAFIARSGWTCEELASGIAGAAPRGPYALVSLLIGVNDQFRGATPAQYAPCFDALLRRAASLAGERMGRVVALSIPDWGVAPYAEGRDRSAIAASIDAFNRANRAASAAVGARYVDITATSRAAADASRFVSDGLHPSAATYAEWAELALDAAEAALRV
jgi:lysophospholipase L1-like esterase